MIDDEFPMFSDLAIGENQDNAKRFAQKELAVKLYSAFRKNHMLCDIENVASDLPLESIRKSDLVILDYHLSPVEGNSEKSISILRELASSNHFNTVVVFTAAPNLNEVWLEIIASMGGAWTGLPGSLEGEAKAEWERLSDDGALPTASLDAVMEFAQCRNSRNISPAVRKAAEDELKELGVPISACSDIITALIHKEMAKYAGPYSGAPKHYAIGGCSNETRWIQSKNTFIVVHKKQSLTAGPDHDPAGIMEGLNLALLAWRPNLIQIVVSEIQNVLEREALISGDELLRHPKTQAALWHFLLEGLGPINVAETPDVRAPLSALIDRILDGVRRRLSSDPALLDLASDALLGEIRGAGWTPETWPTRGKSRLDAVKKISRIDDSVAASDIFFRLNSFFGTEVFHRSHITMGTLIMHRASGVCFVVASPACDMTTRAPSNTQVWTKDIYPLKPVVCVHLKKLSSHDGALIDASAGKHIFLENGKDKITFALMDSGVPSHEMIFVEGAGVVRDEGGKKIFSARRLTARGFEGREVLVGGGEEVEKVDFARSEFEVIGQLRSANGNRVLQMISQHLSRIGLDYLSMPNNKN
jgi:hypothetical protein